MAEPTGEVRQCRTCAGRVEIKLMLCAIHKVCTSHKELPGVVCCQTCPDYMEKK